jgi:hypothetical protein
MTPPSLIIFILGISGSLLVLSCMFCSARHLQHHLHERSGQFDIYFNWIMRHGTEQEKRVALRLARGRDLEAIQKMVGFGLLVDP